MIVTKNEEKNYTISLVINCLRTIRSLLDEFKKQLAFDCVCVCCFFSSIQINHNFRYYIIGPHIIQHFVLYFTVFMLVWMSE